MLQGWKEKMFSTGGKEVLIKIVAQAISKYYMSCFCHSYKICAHIDTLCAKFWWSSMNTKKKIHWRKWSSLCSSKDQGSLGV